MKKIANVAKRILIIPVFLIIIVGYLCVWMVMATLEALRPKKRNYNDDI